MLLGQLPDEFKVLLNTDLVLVVCFLNYLHRVFDSIELALELKHLDRKWIGCVDELVDVVDAQLRLSCLSAHDTLELSHLSGHRLDISVSGPL